MSASPYIAQARNQQRLATDPRACVWVDASAGTGKTKVLTDRILSLLLHGVQPERILCLTFTRAAAAEMTERLHRHLNRWTILNEENLSKEIADFTDQPLSPLLLTRARSLFTTVLDTPEGLKMQTIHGFCQTLLQRFPLEAGVSPSFKIMDEPTALEILHQAEATILSQGDSSHLREALEHLTKSFEYGHFSELIHSLLTQRYKLAWLQEGPAPFKAMRKALEHTLQCSFEETEEQLVKDACEINDDVLHSLDNAAHHLSQGSPKDIIRGQDILKWLTGSSRQENLSNYISVFLTNEGTIRKTLATKACCEKAPHIVNVLQEEAERIFQVAESLKRSKVLHLSYALLQVSWTILEQYQSLKKVRNLLDYDDLIAFAGRLLAQPNIAPWVLFKLDGGIDHILIDEAQDTNMQQWKIVETLAQEFFSGLGAQEQVRTLFVVGDAKQSIYSFQGADPFLFTHMRERFSATIPTSQQPWRDITLDLSFRSTSAILQCVDTVFKDESARKGVLFSASPLQHHVFRQGHGGRVEIWPLVTPQESTPLPAWSLPDNHIERSPAPHERLASVIAQHIQRWLREGTLLECRNRPIRPSDILILVQRRSAFVEALRRELKCRHIPVAGADRIALTDHLAVKDLIALGQFLLLPDDDLNLATILKSPFINLTEEDLFTLCYKRGSCPLWHVLKQKALSHPPFERAYTYLSELLARTDYLTPFALYSHILGALQGRRLILARLGPDAQEPVDEFLQMTLTYQNLHTPSLQGFLHWLQESSPTVKREMAGNNRDEVRIMTVHGSKGLQAPIVFLPDTVRVASRQDHILWDEANIEGGSLPIWSPPSELESQQTHQLKQREKQKIDQEYRRLLYVALTRAEDHLYICGWATAPQPSEESWYQLISRALQPIALEQTFDFSSDYKYGWRGQGHILTCPQELTLQEPSNINEALNQSELLIPQWLHQTAPLTLPPAPLLTPSQEVTTAEDPALRSPLNSFSHALYQRGLLIHNLLQYLPALPASHHEAACQAYLREHAPKMPVREQLSIIKSALNVLQTPEFSPFFGTNSKAEVPVMGILQGQQISGQIDRLVVTESEVHILDFKTNQRVPAHVHSVPIVYQRQMAYYKSLLERIYPAHTIRCFLLWTEVPELMELPSNTLQEIQASLMAS